MNRYLILLAMWLCSLSAFAQTDGYNPSNPPLPDFPDQEVKDTTTYYTLVVNSSPLKSGSLNTTGGRYASGASVYLNASNGNNLYLEYWIDGDGNTLSYSRSFYYSMPAHDVTVTAVYRYSPSNPSLPDFPEQEEKKTYKLSLSTKPAGAGSFNSSSFTLEADASTHLYAYTNTNFQFLHWEDSNGNVISTAQNFYYTMPACNTQLYGIYQYNPSDPANPGKNFYDSFTGEVIVDDFNPGSLSSAIYDVTKGSTSNITKITVAGKINSNDFSIANNYSSCSVVDLSRTTGVTTVPSYCYYGNTQLNRLFLPASISSIEYCAFENATALTELTCYSTVPPTLGGYVFSGVTEGLIVNVPVSSLVLYEQATAWKDYVDDGTIVIMPIRDQVSSVEINLPLECADGRYKNMPLELLNIKSGQRYKYVVTDRINYIFNNLIRGTRYVAYLKNLSGSVLAKSDTICVDEENVSFDFLLENMKQLRSIQTIVMSSTGEDVTSKCTVNWYDANGTFLSQGKSLSGQVSGTKVKCSVALSQDMAMRYVLPTDSVYEVIENNNTLIFTLKTLPTITLSGKVVDKMSQQPLSGASVTVSQTLNGKYSKSFTSKTDNKGEYGMQVFAAPSSLTYAASDYISQTIVLPDSVLSLSEAMLDIVKLKSITGATITTNFTYTTSVAATVAPEVQNYYSDYNNVSYIIRNETTGKAITQFNVQYPNIVLLEEVNEGDSLTIIAKSKNNSFMDITTGGKIDDSNRMSVSIPVVQFGGIDATFTTTENSKVLGILYDGKGTFVNKYNYGSSTLSIRELKDGDYTLVTMGESDFFGSIYNIDKFAEAGLKRNVDYIVNKVTVRSGIISPLKNVLIPFFDESKFYYTGNNTSFSVNKTSIVAGNYLTLTAKVDFKDVYKNSVSDVSLVVELPDGTTFVDNSVMVGSSVAYYELDGSTLTIPLDNNVSSDRVRFCIVPTKSGSYSPNAAVEFKLGENSVNQPIGSTSFSVQNIAINVPSEINTPEITISGIASGRADVVVYANGEVLGTTRALANGYWYLTTELDDPYNLEEFSIYANVSASNGLSVNTETKTCLYNKDVIVAKTVEMSFYNGWMKKNISVTFDLEHQTSDATSYSFYTETDFTFAANLSNNDTTIVKNVTIGVYTDHEGWMNLEASYNAKIDRWVAVHKFGSGNLPTGVKVDFDTYYISHIDSKHYNDQAHAYSNSQIEYAEYQEYVNGLIREISEEWNKDVVNDSCLDSLKNVVFQLMDVRIDRDPKIYNEETVNELLANIDSILNDSLSQFGDNFLSKSLEDILELTDGISFGSTKNLTEVYLTEQGFEKIEKTDNTCLFIFSSDNVFKFADLENEIYYEVDMSNSNSFLAKSILKAEQHSDFPSKMQIYMNSLKEASDKLRSYMTQLAGTIDDIERAIDARNSIIADDLYDLDKTITYLEKNGSPAGKLLLPGCKLRYNALVKEGALNAKILGWFEKNISTNGLRVGRIGGGIFAAVDIYLLYSDMVEDLNKVIDTYYLIPKPCEGDQQKANSITNSVVGVGIGAGVFYGAQMLSDAAQIALAITGSAAAIPSGGTTLSAVGIAIGLAVGNLIASEVYSRNFDNGISSLNSEIAKLKCYICPVCHKKPCQCCKKCGHYPCICKPIPEIPPILDPSGYVYEGVSSNRLQGVTATCYYKETVEDMYGDLHEEVVLWDAEEYAQKNPLFTDENGMYAWDVPQGLWQVKFEKEGYAPTQSEWLPVPPPQMDVNIGMVQNSQPEVVSARAYEDGVEVAFSKYMNVETLSNDNIYVKVVKDEQESLISDAQIELLNNEVVIAGIETEYASKVKVATDQLGYYDEAYLIVSTGVNSYAGVPMAQTYEQKLDVEKKVRELIVETEFNVEYDGQKEVIIAATPADAAVGKKLSVQTASDMIAKTNVSEVTFDADGQAKFTVTGELYGTTALNYSLIDADLTASSIVNVLDPVKLEAVKAPTASRISGTAVYRGQTVALSCESEGATIYYTTDGSCPCDESSRIRYERPIAINDSMTIKIMSVGINFDESEVKTYTYSIRQADVRLNLAQGWNWNSHDMATPLDVSELSGVASRVLTQTEEAIDDPVFGFVGTLKSVDGAQTMKIQTSKDTVMAFTGEQYNPSLTSITLNRGWNWLGYPSNIAMTLSDALSYLDVDEGDCISNLDGGFSTYSDGEWNGTLQVLSPGSGYLYKSVSEKSFIYNNVPTVSNAKALYVSRLATRTSPWSVNRHAYPNMMPVVAQVCYSDGTPADSTYYVGVFAGNECRGIGDYNDNVMYMSVYGDSPADLTFKAFNKVSGCMYDVKGSAEFVPDILGSRQEPFRLYLNVLPTIIDSVESSVGPDEIYNLSGMKISSIDKSGIYIIHSTDADGHSVVRKQYVK